MTHSVVTFFPVGENNGGMVLLRLNDSRETTVLVYTCIGEDPIADHCDVGQELRDRLPTDAEGRPYVDAFILTHRHEDHLRGIQQSFHLGVLTDYPDPKDGEDGKIVIRELWGSYHFWKTASKTYELCDNAKAFNKEMKRRVNLFKEAGGIQEEGERAIVVGVDPDGQCEGLDEITYDIDDVFTQVNSCDLSGKLSGLVLGPLYQQDEEDDECFKDKNRQSIVLQLTVDQGSYEHKLLVGADAECLVWETLWDKYGNETEKIEYDVLQAPHHCSWHSLSYDSQSKDDNPQVKEDAKSALSQAKEGACIVSQSKPIKNNDSDPPSKAAKEEYLTIVSEDRFFCTDEYPKEDKPEPLEFNLTGSGPQERGVREKSKLSVAALASTRESYSHG